MRRLTLSVVLSSTLLAGCQTSRVPAVASPAHTAETLMVMKQPSELEWRDLGLVPGVQIVLLSGDPMKSGHYVLRLKFPPDTRMPAHWHPQVEYATILSGTILLAMGEEEVEANLKPYGPGTFSVIPPRMAHYGRSLDEVIIELSGPGPYEVVFVNDADDPRKSAQ